MQIFNYDVNIIAADIAVPKSLVDQLIKVHGNALLQKSIGIKGDWTFELFRLIPIEQDPSHKDEKDFVEPHYRTTLNFVYPAGLDDKESDKIKIDDNDPGSIVEYTKHLIRLLRPECELTDIQLKIWDLVPRENLNNSEKYPFKTYNPVQRRRLQDINPLSVNSWPSSRVTLLGDAAHAMSPLFGLGTTNAIQDADVLSQALLNYTSENYISCIKEYENEMLKRSSENVLDSRTVTFQLLLPVGYFGSMIRTTMLKIKNTIINFRNFVTSLTYSIE